VEDWPFTTAGYLIDEKAGQHTLNVWQAIVAPVLIGCLVLIIILGLVVKIVKRRWANDRSPQPMEMETIGTGTLVFRNPTFSSSL
jgi:hypothetical protein